MYLLFDASANGRPRSWSAPPSDTFSWPRLIHLSWLLYDKSGALTADEDRLIKPGNFEISKDALKMHHLHAEDIETKGEELATVIDDFDRTVREASYIITFNQRYQENVVKAEFFRLMKDMQFGHTESFCLMRESTYFCKLPSKRGGYKWPSLPELHTTLFGKTYENPGNARNDLKALSRAFNRMMKLGELEDWW